MYDLSAGVVNFVDARTKWFDDAVRTALRGGVIKQVVAVAAGYDTRAYRFGPSSAVTAGSSNVTFFEVDLPAVSK
jgi:O-methyltransferase involved in polyketide biosynthesis